MERDCIKVFKCLADKSRLLIINNLMEGPMYVELLSQRLNLSASTVSFHLKKLEEADIVYSVKEQYYVVYHPNRDMLSMSPKDLISVGESEIDVQRKGKTIQKERYRCIFEYGKLKSIPVQQKKRKIVLEEIAKSFEYGRRYTEREVNIIIADFHDDFCTIRREMVAFNIFKRKDGIYELIYS